MTLGCSKFHLYIRLMAVGSNECNVIADMGYCIARARARYMSGLRSALRLLSFAICYLPSAIFLTSLPNPCYIDIRAHYRAALYSAQGGVKTMTANVYALVTVRAPRVERAR